MMQNIRKLAGKLFVNLLIGLLALSFAVWGISDVFRGISSDVVAQVGSHKITAPEFADAFNQQLRNLSRRIGKPITPDDARQAGIDRQVLGDLLRNAALESQATELGLDISDQTTVDLIAKNPAYQNVSGTFDPDSFRARLNAAGYSERQFLTLEKQQLLQSIITSNFADSFVPSRLVEMVWRSRNEQRDAQFFIIPKSSMTIPEPSVDDLKTYYDANKRRYTEPEYRTITVMIANPEQIGKTIQIDDAELKSIYEERQSSYSTPEKRVVEQISFNDPAEAQKAYDDISNGKATFADIAKARGLKDSDYKLGEMTKDAYPDPSISKAVFAAPLEKITGPIKGDLAIALVKVTKVTPGSQKTFADVRDELLKSMQTEKGRDEAANIHDRVEDARAGGATLAEIAKELDLEIKTLPPVDAQGLTISGDPLDLVDSATLTSQAFSSDVGVENDPMQISGEGFLWYDVDQVSESHIRKFDDVKDKVSEDWKAVEARKLLSSAADDVIEKLQNGGSNFNDTAQKYTATIKSVTGVKRNEATPEFDTTAMAALFSTSTSGYAKALENDGGGIKIIKSSPVMIAPFDANSDEAKAITNILSSSMAADMTAYYVRDIQNKFGVVVNEQVWASLTANRN